VTANSDTGFAAARAASIRREAGDSLSWFTALADIRDTPGGSPRRDPREARCVWTAVSPGGQA
jgi:hypothetical protein